MNENDMKKMFEISQQNSNRGLEITPEEAEKFKNAFDDPEFCKLMAEYVAELQDPSNRAETESYISQLEGENKVPEGKELVRPHAGFVAKTKKIENGTESKLFINIVSSEKIAAPTKKSTPQGQNWSLPYSLGPPHMEKDKGGESVPAFDCCYHPEALTLANRSKQFRDLLVTTAISGIEESFKRQRQQVTLKKDFHVLKGVIYKSGQIPTMLIDLAGKNKWSEPTENKTTASSGANSVASAKMTNSATPPSSTIPSSPAIQKGFLNKSSKEKSSTSQEASQATPPLVQVLSTDNSTPKEPKKPQVQVPSGPVSPEYTLTERGVLSLGDFGTNGGMQVSSTRPAELVYRIDIPLVNKTSEVELDVGERDLKLKYSNVYDLHVRLPYPVFDKKGAAKFDKAKKQLSITLPVQPAVIAPTSPVVDESSPDVEPEPESNPSINEPVRRAKEPSKSHGRWVEGKHHEITSDESRQLAQEVRKKAEEAQKLASESVKSPPSPLPVEAPVNPSEGKDGSQSQTEFIPAAVFIGRKPGYAFKRGDQGLGYYIDRYQNSSSSLPESLSQSKPVDTPVASPKSPLSSLDHHLPNPELEHRSFVYEFRQTKEAVAVIIQVPGIIESTVDLKFGKRSFDIYFKAVAADTSTRRVVEYSQGFDLYDEIESDKCKYDVATQNLVILLHKSKAEYWIDKGTSGGAVAGGEQSSKKDILAPRAYRSSVAEMSEKDYGESGRTGIAIPSPTELLEAMKFSTQGLLDLD